MANTFDSSLVIDRLVAGAVTKLQNKLAQFSAYSRDYGVDPLKPLSNVLVKLASTTQATLTDPTDFFVGGSKLDPISVTVHHKVQPMTLTFAEVNQGFKLDDIAAAEAAKFADSLNDVVMALITEANFGNAAVTSSAAAFGDEELRTLYGALKKSDIKNVMLESDYYARFLRTDALSLGAAPGRVGFTGFYENTKWDAAGASVVGFACNPQAIAIATGMPIIAPPVRALMTEVREVVIPGINLPVTFTLGANLQNRSIFASMETMIGAAVGDSTAGKIVKS